MNPKHNEIRVICGLASRGPVHFPYARYCTTKHMAFELYPNPHDGSFSLLLTGEKGLYRYRVDDLAGRLLVQEQFAKEAGKQTISLHTPLSNGIYLLSIVKPDGTPAGVKRMFISR